MKENLKGGSAVEYGGVFVVTHTNSKGEIISVEETHNLVPLEGRVHINDVVFGGVAATPFYVGLYANNYQIVEADTMSTFLTNASEVTAYTEASRQLYNAVSASDGTVSNTASKAVFTANDSVTARGAFISTSSVKGGTAGKASSAVLFSSPKLLTTGDTLTVEYKYTTSSST